MRWLVIAVIVLIALVAAGAVGYQPILQYWEQRNTPNWRTAEVIKGDIVSVVNATGTIKPVLQVSVGSFVSGPVQELYVEFNQEVKKGDRMAKIDPRIYKANVDRDQATLATRQADVARVEALLQQAINDWLRVDSLWMEDNRFIARAELDKVWFGGLSLQAQLGVAQMSVDQAQAQLDLSIAQLNYTDIQAPCDGIVINRKIDPGQTVAAQFQTPELFVIAPDMRNKMHIHASVDEADIGLIRNVQQGQLPVTFTVDAYPDELFTGRIEEIRLNSVVTSNVVTYPVVVAASNPDLKLLPGMTASISFEVDRRSDVVKIPNSALRFFPLSQQVRSEDRPLLEGKERQEQKNEPQSMTPSAEDRSRARRERNRRHVWMQDGTKLRAIEVVTGISDSQFTELVSDALQPGDRLVIGTEVAGAK
jgi:HlyD family secretion protein